MSYITQSDRVVTKETCNHVRQQKRFLKAASFSVSKLNRAESSGQCIGRK